MTITTDDKFSCCVLLFLDQPYERSLVFLNRGQHVQSRIPQHFQLTYQICALEITFSNIIYIDRRDIVVKGTKMLNLVVSIYVLHPAILEKLADWSPREYSADLHT